jgi:hypothetical protein
MSALVTTVTLSGVVAEGHGPADLPTRWLGEPTEPIDITLLTESSTGTES